MKTGLPSHDWDTQLQQRRGSILQSLPWAELQERLGRKVLWDEGKGWQWTAALRESKGVRYLLCSYGPVADDERAFSEAIESLRGAAKKLNTDFIRIEPQSSTTVAGLAKLGAKNITELDPQFTAVVDLTKSVDDLRNALASGHRNTINGTERRRITFRTTSDPASADLKLLQDMLRNTAKRASVTFLSNEYYQKMYESLATAGVAKLYIAEHEGKPVAGAIFFDWGTTRYYAHAGAFQDQNRQVRASTSLVWQAMMDAKAAGISTFDMYGVAPEGDAHHHLAALTYFKRAFGSKQVDYLGTWDIPIKAGKYRAYSVYRKLRGMK